MDIPMSHSSCTLFPNPFGHPSMHPCANDTNQGIRELVFSPQIKARGCTLLHVWMYCSSNKDQEGPSNNIKEKRRGIVCLLVCLFICLSFFFLDAGSHHLFLLFFFLFFFFFFRYRRLCFRCVDVMVIQMTKQIDHRERAIKVFLFFNFGAACNFEGQEHPVCGPCLLFDI